MALKSHQYQLGPGWALQCLGLPLLCLAGWAGLLHLSVGLSILPHPRNTWDMDRCIMAHKIDLARQDKDAEVLLIGDSSCLMNIDTDLLESLTQKPMVNLGLVSFLDLETLATPVRLNVASDDPKPKVVVLLLHPDFLRRAAPSKAHVEWFNHYLERKDYYYRTGRWKKTGQILGLHIAEGRLLSWLPRPLTGDFARFYGFTKDFEDYMSHHNGSAVDPRKLSVDDLRGSTEYRVSRANWEQAKAFRQRLPVGSRLIVGLTPTPEGFFESGFQNRFEELLEEWAEALAADQTLPALPATLPDELFANKTHLNQTGRDLYTRELAKLLVE